MIVQQLAERVQVAVGKRNRRACERLRHPNRLDARKKMGVEVRVSGEIGGQIPVVPAVVTAKEYFVAAGDTAGDADRNRTRLAATFGIADHLGAGNCFDQLLGQLDL